MKITATIILGNDPRLLWEPVAQVDVNARALCPASGFKIVRHPRGDRGRPVRGGLLLLIEDRQAAVDEIRRAGDVVAVA